MPPWKRWKGMSGLSLLGIFSGTRLGHELCTHCFSRCSAMLVGLAMGGIAPHQPDAVPP